MHTVRLALRRLRLRPARSAATALTLALGIGAVTAAFAAVDGVLLRDLPVRAQDELVVVWNDWPARDFTHVPFTPESYEAVEDELRTLTGIAGMPAAGAQALVFEGADEPVVLDGAILAGDFFGVLGARPAAGRLLGAADDEPGAQPVLVLSHDAWINRFGGDRGVVGSTLRYDGRPFTVAGVAPEGFDIPGGTDVWLTLRGVYPDWAEDPPCCIEMDVVGRMAGGTAASAVAADIAATLRADPDPERAAFYEQLQPVATGLEEHVVGPLRPVLRIVFAAALLLLLAAVANATLLFLAGGGATARDAAIRRALGAERGRIVRQLVADAGVVGVLGAAAGLALGWLALRVLLPLAPAELPRLDAVGLDARSVAFALLVGLGSTALAGAVAGLTFARGDIRALLSAGGRFARGGAGIRRVVAALQVALTVVVAVGAGLLVRTVVELNRLEPGFQAERLSVVSLRTPYTWFQVPETYFTAVEDVVRDLEGRAGVVAARPTLAPPFQQGLEAVLRAEGQTEEDVERNPFAVVDAVLPGHFEALGTPLLRGRALTAADNRREADPVVVINESLARTLFPGGDPVGRRISGVGEREARWTVVGVVADTRYRDWLEPRPVAYYPVRRMANAPLSWLLVRTAPGGPASVAGLVAEAFATADPAVRVLGESRMTDVLRRPTVRPRFAAGVLLAFAAATLLLAALGVYGVFTVWVHERTREMGVRRALGAQRAQIVSLVLRGILRVAVVGAGVGLVAALWATRLLESLLFGVPATDPATFAAVVAVSLTMALAAGLAPALRASSTDPAVSLRAE